MPLPELLGLRAILSYRPRDFRRVVCSASAGVVASRPVNLANVMLSQRGEAELRSVFSGVSNWPAK